jgi:WD40 repeat protein
MKKSPFLLIALLSSVMMLGVACNTARESNPNPTGGERTLSFTLTSTSPTLTFTISTPLPSATATLVPSASPTASPIAPTPPFLPANLLPISPQNVSKIKPVAVLPEQSASVVAYSPDGRRFAAGLFRSNQIKIWDLASGQELLNLSGHVDPRTISYLAFSPDGARLASGAQGWDAPNDSLILWDANTGRELQRFSGVLGAISPGWRLVALTQRDRDRDTTLNLFDLASSEELHTLPAPSDIYGVSFSPDGQRVSAKMYHVFQDLFAFWSVDSGRLDLTLYDWLGFSYSPDGRFIAALVKSGPGDERGELNIYQASNFKWIKTIAREADSLWYTNPAFSPDGLLLAASFSDLVTLWDTQTWEKLISLPVSDPSGLAFSPDGRILTTHSLSDIVQLWGVEVGQ